ncbi:hypothetical protein [Marivita geojedonensis]|uniref:hypothetical protein n=1 Tax=Marivita geojedonensis TaxID=1123756 RepID=UPI001B808276|nr:hypothetical protein [Marivita geojedonensis]
MKVMAFSVPKLISSPKSVSLLVDGQIFRIRIYRLETEQTWTLELVEPNGNSRVWIEAFGSEKEARQAALRAFTEEHASPTLVHAKSTSERQTSNELRDLHKQ